VIFNGVRAHSHREEGMRKRSEERSGVRDDRVGQATWESFEESMPSQRWKGGMRDPDFHMRREAEG
jgi:hypothetical protein